MRRFGSTAHNPGQLVFHPIIKLKTLGLDVTDYVRSLEQVGIELLQWLGFESTRRKGYPRLWIDEKKIALVGVQLKRWVRFHGMAVNINNERSLELLDKARRVLPMTQTKSSLMLGLGETDEELLEVLKDLRSIGCDRLAQGQYLRPDKNSLEVVKYITPEKFDCWADQAKQLGFTWVQSSPFTRSSYHAEDKY